MTRNGFHIAKITSATAMNPRPAIMFSNQALAYAIERCAPPMPASAAADVTVAQ